MLNRSGMSRATEMGFSAGLRTMTGPALLSHHLSERPMWQLDSRPERALASPAAQLLLGIAALAELTGDKLPSTPSRMEPGPLLGRAVSGAVGGAVLMHRARQPPLLGALIGALGAVSGATAGYTARRALTRRGIPDAAVAVVEDLLAIAVARRAIRG
jgi:uncharacterized membrane protein